MCATAVNRIVIVGSLIIIMIGSSVLFLFCLTHSFIV